MSPLAGAQSLWVYSVTGKAEMTAADGNVQILSRGVPLTWDSKVRTESDASLCIYDRDAQKLIVAQSTEWKSVRDLARSQKKAPSLAKRFSEFFWLALNGRIEEKNTGNSGTVYRDSQQLRDILASLGRYQVRLSLVDISSRKEMGTTLPVGQCVYLRITNMCDIPLFVSVLDKDEAGELYPCLYTSYLTETPQLLLPPGGTVTFDAFPLCLTDPAGTEILIPVTYPEPFLLEELIQESAETLVSVPSIQFPIMTVSE